MAKMCPACNLKHKNSATKCAGCGAELSHSESYVHKKRIIILSIISLLLIVATVLSIVYFTSSRAKLRRLMRDFKKGDIDGVMELFPDFLLNARDENFYYFEVQLPNAVKHFSENPFSYRIDKMGNPTSRELDSIVEHLEDYTPYGYDRNKLEDAKMAMLTIRGTSPVNLGSSFDRLLFLKYDGKWYWWPFFYY